MPLSKSFLEATDQQCRVPTYSESRRITFIISTAVRPPSQPLFASLEPERSIACSTLLVVKTPKPMGIRYFEMASPIPRVTASDTYSKCGVSPRITAPKQTRASYFPLAAIRSASKGISNAPGTRITVTSFSSPPWLFSPSKAPSRNFSVMKLLNRLTIIPILIPRASSLPSIILAMSLRHQRGSVFGGLRFKIGKNMPELTLFRTKIVDIGVARRNLQRHPFFHFQSVPFEAEDFARIVGQQADALNAEIAEHLGADAIVPKIFFKA